MGTVLVVEDDRDLLEAVCTTLELAGFSVLGAADAGSALELLAARDIGLVLSDVGMAPMDGLTLLGEIKRRAPELPVVLMTAYGDVEQAVAAMRAGAADDLTKPIEAEALVALVRRLSSEPEAAVATGFVAEDPCTVELLRLAARVARSQATVLLTGESGSGKEMFARYVHVNSARSAGPFVAINCAAIPENLLEATLFGHERGAFTGAAQSQPGKFEQSNGGTLLLDEISEMPLALQAKLLRVLQEREVERVGGRKPIALDLRVLATTNRDLRAMVADGDFREDLFYRLNVFPLHVPPLRERPRDIVPLARHFAARIAEGRRARFSAEAEALLRSHAWPGNVRELENTIQRALILASGDTIAAADIVLSAAHPRAPTAIDSAPTDIRSLERDHILATLREVGGSRKLAVQRLGISERTLRYKLQQYRLEGII
ncbi:MAG: sigma-54-dependent Fis family transcriptional regulator [Betaproteobacteria bacterium]|nr:MAG: sigma-54-dependent Fis family transcriptional regulator [Betaproteobacteria bacterium]